MRQIVVDEAGHRGAFAAVPFRAFIAAEGAQAGQVLAAGANLKQLKRESLMFGAGENSGTKVWHGAPVENLQGRRYVKGEQKANSIFAWCSPVGLSRRGTRQASTPVGRPVHLHRFPRKHRPLDFANRRKYAPLARNQQVEKSIDCESDASERLPFHPSQCLANRRW